MADIPHDDARAVALVAAIQAGDIPKLEALFERDPTLPAARIVDERQVGRTLLHVLADWPGHRPESNRTVKLLVRHGADINARVRHPEREEARETPLHWAASNDDVSLVNALLDAGADIEAEGAIFTGGPPMSDAVIFGQWNAARRLLERGAKTTFWQAAALGLLDEVRREVNQSPMPSKDEITNAFWNACRGGHRPVAEYLLSQGADLNWIGHDHQTPLEVAKEGGHEDLIAWLRSQGA